MDASRPSSSLCLEQHPGVHALCCQNGKTIFADKTQVGTINDPTPVFSADMTTIVFNPEWIAPGSVLVKSSTPAVA